MLYKDAADVRRATARQLYQDWHGHYVLYRLHNGTWRKIRRLSLKTAMTYRTKPDEVLEIIWRT